MKKCSVWLYKGAWNEWKINDIDMAIPMSPDQIIKKRKAIYKHPKNRYLPYKQFLDQYGKKYSWFH